MSKVNKTEEFCVDAGTSHQRSDGHFTNDASTKSADRRPSPSSNFSSAARRHLPLDNEIWNARQRIREQTKSMVEQRKLAKRKAMMGQAVEEKGVKENEEEIARGDAQIEQSIKLGAKYVGESQMAWDYDEEAEEGRGNYVERGEAQHHRMAQLLLVTLARPTQIPAEKEAKFAAMVKWGDGGRRTEEDKTGRAGGTEERRTEIGVPAVPAPSAESDQQAPPFSASDPSSLLVRSAPLSWARWVRQNGTRQWAGRTGTRLRLDIRRVEFDHHWLFTGTELRERALINAFEAFMVAHERALKAAKEWLMGKQMADEQAPRAAEDENETRAAGGEENGHTQSPPNVQQLDLLLDNFLGVRTELTHCVQVLERAWNAVDKAQGRFVLRRLEGHAELFEEECEGGVPDELRDFFRSPMFFLGERASEEEPPAAEARRPAELEEQQRKKAAIACHYKVQLFFNGLFVGTSDPLQLLWPSFCVPFSRIFDLQVFERVEQLQIRLLERLSRMAKWQEIAEVSVPLSADNGEGKTSRHGDGGEPPQVAIQFVSAVQRGGFKGSLGCGQKGGTAAPFMQGRIFCALKAINGKSEERQQERERARREQGIAVGRRPLPSLFPRGAILCSAQLLSSDLRLNALEKRWLERNSRPQQRIAIGKWTNEGKEMKQLSEDELLEEEEEEEQAQQLKQRGADFGLEAQKRAGRAMALSLRRFLRQRADRWRLVRDPAELVREEPLPSLSLFPQLLLIGGRPFDFSRRLKPMRRHPLLPLRRAPFLSEQQQLSSSRRRLILNVQFASFVPKRLVGPSQIFLQFSTKATSLSTTIVDGRSANWQETLVMDVGGAEESGEDDDEQCLEVDMFDVEVRPMEGDDREQDTRHEREERRWMGSARVALRALVALGKADGHLTLQSPIFHSGYRSHPSDRPITFRLLLSIDPPPAFPPQMSTAVGQFEDDSDYGLSEGVKFENRFRQRFPDRRVLATVRSTEGKKLIASRFLRPVAPPAQIVSLFSTNPKQAVSAAAQIAASVPLFVDSDELAPTMTPIWSRIDEILRFGTASADEVGTLLCCWLLGLQLPALLLLGSSLSDGPNSAAVHVKFPADGDQWLIIPSNGHHFNPSDPTCPFLSVGTILSTENAYANLQNAFHPSQLDFDLAKRANWAPLFPAGVPSAALFPPVQPETVSYGTADENQLMELRASLERDIRLQFDQARPFAIPQWNLLASRILREVLVDSLALFPDPSGSVSRLLDVESRLEQLQPAFRPSALAFRFPFFSRAQIVHQVIRTQVHLNSEPHAQFALALHLQPVAGDAILSCAVAICTLMPNKAMQNR